MKIITLYRYEDETGVVTISPEEKGRYISTTKRIIADDMKDLIKNGDTTARYKCIDVDDTTGWSEVDITPEEKAKIEALRREYLDVLHK